MITFNKTKIVATIGPASMSKEILEQMIEAGCNVCRINGSHGDHALQQQVIDNIRAINLEQKLHVAILYDLQGPKLRVGDVINNGVMLVEGQELILSTKECIGDDKKVFVKYPSLIKDVKPREKILVDDGKIELQVISTNSIHEVVTKVLVGGLLTSRKGVNLPSTKISLPSLTEKDLHDLDFALNNNVEWIGLSFVRAAKDIEELKNIINSKNKTSRCIAKIEKPEAVLDIENIIKVTDGIMVARGDLGVEMPLEQVPLIQKMIVKKCIHAAKPVIIATQMMESMIKAQRPTRAEVNDVGNSVLDGADAVMLSAETSVGDDPVNVVRTMAKIINTVQTNEEIYWHEVAPLKNAENFISDSVLYNACVIAKQSGARAIVSMTHSGYSALKIAAVRPQSEILVFTDNLPLLNTLSLVWGVRGFYYNRYVSSDETINDIKNSIKQTGLANKGDIVIHVFSMPLLEKGKTNTIKLNVID